MDEPANQDDTIEGGEEIAALTILGIFLCFLGVTMVVAAFWPPTWVGKLTNLLAALLLLAIGAIMCVLGRAERRTHRLTHAQGATGDCTSATKGTQPS
jgi:hypothetical protein